MRILRRVCHVVFGAESDQGVRIVRAGLVEGKSAAITGAAQGIGLEIARLLHEEGAKVMILDVNEDQAASAAASLGEGAVGRGGCDVTTRTPCVMQWKRLSQSSVAWTYSSTTPASPETRRWAR